MAKSDCDPDEIMNAVQRHADETESLRERMEKDYDIYRLAPFDAGDGYQSYTSNEPQTYADKIIGWMAAHRLIVTVPHRGDALQERERNDQKERFLIGLLKAVDEELTMRTNRRMGACSRGTRCTRTGVLVSVVWTGLVTR